MTTHAGGTGRRVGLSLMRVHELFGGDFQGLLEAARWADELGVDEVHVSDNVSIRVAARDAREGFPYPVDYPWLEPLTVLIAPLRPVILLAWQLATLDAMPAAVVDGTVGVRRQDGALRRPVHLPLPAQGAGPPISLGLPLTSRGLERVVRLVEGWFPPPMVAEALTEALADIGCECARQGRDRPVRFTAALAFAEHGLSVEEAQPPDPATQAESLWRAGADVVVAHPLPHCRYTVDLRRFIADLVAAGDSDRA